MKSYILKKLNKQKHVYMSTLLFTFSSCLYFCLVAFLYSNMALFFVPIHLLCAIIVEYVTFPYIICPTSSSMWYITQLLFKSLNKKKKKNYAIMLYFVITDIITFTGTLLFLVVLNYSLCHLFQSQ